jgi:alpha-tubulin suppressor-like RCC1 family protein
MSGTVETNVFTLNKLYQLVVDGQVVYNSTGASLWSWGSSMNGALGVPSITTNRSSPIQIPGSTWCSVDSGGQHVLALKSDNTLWAWGRNSSSSEGALGDGTVINRSSPIQIPGTEWVEVSGGWVNSHARKSDGTLWAWGFNCSGSLGLNNASTLFSSPVQIPGTQWIDIANSPKGPNNAARKSDGTLWTWGLNSPTGLGAAGKLGNNTIIDRSSPVQVPGTQWTEVAVGLWYMLGRKSDGTLWSWGRNIHGSLGNNTTSDRSSPIQVPGTQWSQLATTYGASIARKSDGSLWIWGSNQYGQLGQNDRVYRSSPVQIPGTQWIDVAAGPHVVLARKTDSTLWAWSGSSGNPAGSTGDNANVLRSSPVQVPGTEWISISAGYNRSFARKIV